MKILVSGASGFIGRHVVQALAAHPGLQIITTAPEEALPYHIPGAVHKPWDISQPPATDLLTYFGLPDVLIHLAWQGLPDYRRPEHETVYLPQHIRFLDNLIHAGLKHLTVIGTCLEYGMQSGALQEDLPAQPTLPYPKAKRALYQHLNDAHPQLQLNWIRLFYVYGQGQFAKSLLPQLEAALERGDTEFPMSPGDQTRDFIAVEEAARIIITAAQSGVGHGIINGCSGIPFTVKAFVENYLEKKGMHIRLRPGAFPYPDYEPMHFWGDRCKLDRILAHEKN